MNAVRRVSLFLVSLRRSSLFSVVLALLLIACSAPAFAQVVINEVDYDQVGADSGEFIELKNTSAGPINLDNYTVQLVNGSGTAVYDTIDLPNVNLAAGDYYVICANAGTGVNCDLDDGPDTDFIQNGSPDAIGLRLSGVLVDAVSYEGNTGAPYTEGTGTPVATASDSNTIANLGLSRFPDGTDTNNNSADFTLRCITPGTANIAANSSCAAPSALPSLTVTDVTQVETNAGETTFTFSVNLSAAGAGDVTFDITTADDTAQDFNPETEDNDYLGKAFSGQTIPAGNTSYNFDVTVVGDTTPEPNETFFVNVTNVTGANVTDGQGLGTITNDDIAPILTINDVTQNETNAGATTFTFTVSLDIPAGPGGITFDIATADDTAQDDTPATEDDDYVAQSLTGQTIAEGNSTYIFDVTVNGDTAGEQDETFFVNVDNITGTVIPTDMQGVGTIVNDDITLIHDIQGTGATTGMSGATVIIEGVVIGDFQPVPNDNRLSGFFVQEEDADADANPMTSEGIFVFCSACPTNVAEGQRVQVTGTVSEFFGGTQVTATTAPAIVITNAGNNLAQVTPATINLPVVAPVVDDFYEAMECMLVNYSDTLTVSEYFEQARYGRIELYEGGRPYGYTENNTPDAVGYAAHLDNLNRRRVYIDDDDNVENSVLNLPDGTEFVFHPQANGGLSIGTQGTDFFRGGDTVNSLTGILHYSFSGGSSPNEWRIRPTAATPATFTVANPRPATPPAVGGAIRAASVNVLNYFTTLNMRGADSVAELTRQRERTSIVLCDLDTDVAALMEIENHATNATITDLLGAVNTRCGGAHPYTFINTGGALGTDEIRVLLIYRTGVVSPVGSPMVDNDAVHNRPPTAQTFDVVDAANPAFGQRFTVLANHSKSKGSCPGPGPDADQNDGQGCWAATRVSQHSRLLTWINTDVVPAAGDPDVLMLGDFNSNGQETPTTTLTSGGFTDLEVAFDSGTYSYVFDGQLGHLDYAFSSASLTPQITGAAPWHINADENPLLDYNDEVDDGSAESAFEKKPDGSSLVPPRVLFQPASRYRASDHDPVLLGIFGIADLVITKTDSPDPVNAGNNLTYTITVTNNGPDAAASAEWTDTITGTTFVSMPAVAGWSCTTPAVGAAGLVSCTNPSFAVGSAVFTLTVAVAPSVADGTVISNTVNITSTTTEGNSGDESDTETTTVATSANLSVTKSDSPDPVNAGSNITYTITVNNAGPSNASTVELTDAIPMGTTFVSLSSPGGWSCVTPAVGGTGTISCTNASLGLGDAVFTLVVNVQPSNAAGNSISNSATVTSTTSDPNGGNETGSSETTVSTSADLSVTKSDSPDPVNAGANLTYTITVNNAGPSNASTVTLDDTVPSGTTFVSLSSPAGWSCSAPAVGGTGDISCSAANVDLGDDVFTLVVATDPATAAGTVIDNSATVATNATVDPNSGNETGSAATTVATSANLSVTKSDSPDPVNAGANLTYTITVNNAGPSNASTVNLTDAVPPNTTFVSLSSPAGWSCLTPAVGGTGNVSCSIATLGLGDAVFTLVVAVDASVAAGTVISNDATVTSTTSDPATGNETGSATTTVATSADLSVTKADTPDPVTAGTNLTYTITVNNSGPSDALSPTLNDTVPAGTTFVSLSAPGGWSCTTPAVGGTGNVSCSATTLAAGNAAFTLVVNVDAGLADGTTITNTATAASPTDSNATNDSDIETTTVGTGSADLSVTKTDSPDPVTPGTNLTYTIIVNNAGPSNATSATLADNVPADTTFVSLAAPAGWSCTTPAVGGTGAISCSTPSLAMGDAVFTLVVNVNPFVIAASLTNTATTGSATTDPNPGNESDTETTSVGSASANLSVTKTDSPDPVTPGSNLTYTITLNNAGPSNATTVVLADNVPANTTFVSLAAPGGWSCATPAVGGTGAISCSNASIGLGDAVFTLIVNVDASATDGTVITNTATATSATADPTPGNESATATTTVDVDNADLSVTKTDDADPVTAGANLTYTLTVNNAGPDAATSVTLNDTLPAETTFVSLAAPAGWSCTTPAVGATGAVSCSNASMAIGNAVFTLVVNVASTTPAGTVITNTATVISTTFDPATGSESDTETTSVISPATVTGTKSVSGTFIPGSTVTYTIVLSNAGPAAQSNNPTDEFTDVLQPQLTLVSANATSGTAVANVGTNTVTWNGSIAAGASVTITIQALLEADVPVGTPVTNQGTISSDADGDGSNEATSFTTGPSGFLAGAPTGIDEVPALDGFGLAIFAAILAALGLVVMRRS